MIKKTTQAFLLFISMSSCTWAIDGLFVSIGKSHTNQTDVGRISLTWDWDRQWFSEGNWYLTGYWQFDLGYWDDSGSQEDSNSIVEVGVTPVFRLIQNKQVGLRPWIEAALGAHLISDNMIEDQEMGTSFQFGSHFGAGVRFGGQSQFELGLRIQHLSNANLSEENDGINLHLLHFGYHFR